MLTLLSRAYLYLLAVCISLLIAGLLTMHIGYLAGSQFEPNGRLYALVFGVNLPVFGLAEDRNIWEHEVKRCPKWLRGTFYGLFVYAVIVMSLCILFGMMHTPTAFLAASAFTLAFTCGSVCILYATLASAAADTNDLRQRTKRSLIMTSCFSTLYLVSRFLPHQPVRR